MGHYVIRKAEKQTSCSFNYEEYCCRCHKTNRDFSIAHILIQRRHKTIVTPLSLDYVGSYHLFHLVDSIYSKKKSNIKQERGPRGLKYSRREKTPKRYRKKETESYLLLHIIDSSKGFSILANFICNVIKIS